MQRLCDACCLCSRVSCDRYFLRFRGQGRRLILEGLGVWHQYMTPTGLDSPLSLVGLPPPRPQPLKRGVRVDQEESRELGGRQPLRHQLLVASGSVTVCA